jgi:hypothetical protein
MRDVSGLAGHSPLSGLPTLRSYVSRRASSWDRSGGNNDWVPLKPGGTVTMAALDGPGCVKHIWATLFSPEPDFLRRVILRMWWDGEPEPSVCVPIGDFFGMGHGLTRNFVSLPLQMSPQDGMAFNCWFPMPFARSAVITAESECSSADVMLYYYVDYQLYERPLENVGYFHAQWRRQNPCDGISGKGMSNAEFEFGGSNLTGAGNYVILEAEGRGHYVGCNMNIENLRPEPAPWPEGLAWPLQIRQIGEQPELFFECFNWYGEGDDMIFVDDDIWPPSLHGTGTEDYFNTAFCPVQEYSAPYHGLTLVGGKNWSGKHSFYRFHIEDPIAFRRRIRVTIEHGHNNHRSDDISSTAYWYQTEPHKPFPPLAAR